MTTFHRLQDNLRRRLRLLADMLPDPLDVLVVKHLTRRPAAQVELLVEERRLVRRLGSPPRVRAGPFVGTRYLMTSRNSALLPKLLGIYEHELHESMEALCRTNPDVVVDVGAAEGYYVVGLARRLRTASLVAFESNEAARGLMLRLARLNGVADRVSARGTCAVDDLERELARAQRAAVICDVEGGEVEILDPERAPTLARAFIVVEVHDGYRPGATELLRARFGSTHDLRFVPIVPRTRADVQLPWDGPERDLEMLVDEGRTNSKGWLEMRPRPAAPPG